MAILDEKDTFDLEKSSVVHEHHEHAPSIEVADRASKESK